MLDLDLDQQLAPPTYKDHVTVHMAHGPAPAPGMWGRGRSLVHKGRGCWLKLLQVVSVLQVCWTVLGVIIISRHGVVGAQSGSFDHQLSRVDGAQGISQNHLIRKLLAS